jgi:hypothetical protein
MVPECSQPLAPLVRGRQKKRRNEFNEARSAISTISTFNALNGPMPRPLPSVYWSLVTGPGEAVVDILQRLSQVRLRLPTDVGANL